MRRVAGLGRILTSARGAPLRLIGRHQPQAPRTPFVLLVVGVLGAGLVVLLVLNSATAADAFTRGELRKRTTDLALREQELSRQVAAMEAPDALAAAARKNGLVLRGEPGFLVLEPDGAARMVGTPVPATAPPPPPPPTTARPLPTASGGTAPSGRATPTAARPGTTPSAGTPTTPAAGRAIPAPRPSPTPIPGPSR